MSNARKLGIIVIELICSRKGGTVGTREEANILQINDNIVRIISTNDGHQYIIDNHKKVPFDWLKGPTSIHSDYLRYLEKAMNAKDIGPNFFKYFKMTTPKKSNGKRKPIVVPFARDNQEKVISCNFENENFAAYMMGASRSGKSTLLHTMICSLIMNYHPDEVELWLVDFKRTEFRKYADFKPPHVKYLLLEESEDLIFDLIDALSNELDRRMKLFSDNGWSKLTEVSSDVYMPAIFVIIDEFAQVSQKLRDSRNRAGKNYVRELENLLAKGAALGFKFIFASQSYITGVEGLSDTAREQIQVRFALKNTYAEIKGTLDINSSQMTDKMSQLLSSVQPYETVFKRIDENTGLAVVDKYYNLMVETDDLQTAIANVNTKIKPSKTDSTQISYIWKNPVYLVDDRPIIFNDLISQYQMFEKQFANNRTYQDINPSDLILYLGVPCSFILVKPVILRRRLAQNILIIGGGRDNQANVILSVIKSFMKTDKKLEKFEIWGHEQYPAFNSHRKRWRSVRCTSDLNTIKERIQQLKDGIIQNSVGERIVVCFGLDLILEDLNDQQLFASNTNTTKVPDSENKEVDLFALVQGEPTREQVDAYNLGIDNPAPSNTLKSIDETIKDLQALISRGSKYGIHFVLCFSQHRDLVESKVKKEDFEHRILFAMSSSESKDIISIDTSDLDNGVFMYSDGYNRIKARTHIYKGIPCNGWIIKNSKVVRE